MPDIDETNLHELQRLFPSSLELSKNSKGYVWTIKMRCQDGDEEKLLERIKQMNDKLIQTFPEPK